MRQGGKTTLSRKIRQDWDYFDLEKSSHYDRITGDYDFFFKEHSENLIIDEAQLVPEIFNELRGVIDQDRNKKGRFILTLSSSAELISGASESLAGRAAILELGTLKINEYYEKPISPLYKIFDKSIGSQTIDYLSNLKSSIDYDQVIEFFLKGGYPEPTLSSNEIFYQNWMENYFKLYIERDVRGLFPKLNLQKYRRFIQMLSNLSGTIINRSEVGRSLDTSEVTIRDYLDIAHGSFVWRTIPSYEKSVSKSLVKMPKGNFRDSGLNHYIQNIRTRDQLLAYPSVGTDWEAFVSEEIIKGMQSLLITNWSYHYFRTKHGAEVDLILEGNFGVLPIEIKFGISTKPKQLTSMKQFLAKNDLPLGIIINNGEEVQRLTENIIQIPAGLI